MLVKFACEGYPEITMLGDVGKRLLKIMGQQSASGVILPKDALAMIARLNAAIDKEKSDSPFDNGNHDNNGDESKIGLSNRAYPLIEMLTNAAENKFRVTWETT